MSVTARPGAETASKCDQCDKHPTVLCPTCPSRLPGMRSRDDQGFRRLYEHDPELARCLMLNARAAKALAQCAESHPAYAELDQEYIEAGLALMALRAKRGADTKLAVVDYSEDRQCSASTAKR